MRRVAVAFAGLAIVILVGLTVLCIAGRIEPKWLFAALFMDAMMLQQLIDVVLVVLLVVVGIVAAMRPRGEAAAGWGGAGFLKVMAWIAPALGVLTALQGLMPVFVAAGRLHPRLAVVAPSLTGVTLPLFLGFLIGAIAAAGAKRPGPGADRAISPSAG